MLNKDDEDSTLVHIELLELLSQLTNKQRVVVALRVAGYTQEECGRILNITRAAVGFSHKKARERLLQLAMKYDSA